LPIARESAFSTVAALADAETGAADAGRWMSEERNVLDDYRRAFGEEPPPECKALTGVKPLAPGLLGLPRDYLNAQLGGWQTGQRKAHAPDCMADIVRRIPAEDLVAVSSYLARQPLPADTRPATRPPAGAPLPAELACGSAPELGTASHRSGVRP
jgi:hypothetical protein